MTTTDLQKARIYKEIIVDETLTSLKSNVDNILMMYVSFLFYNFKDYSLIKNMINDHYADDNGDDILVLSLYGINDSLTCNLTKNIIIEKDGIVEKDSFINISYKCFMINYLKSLHVSLINQLEERVKQEQALAEQELEPEPEQEQVTNE